LRSSGTELFLHTELQFEKMNKTNTFRKMKKRQNFSISRLLVLGSFLVLASSCEKDENQNAPVLSTTEVTEITATTAVSGGNVMDDGGTTVTDRGVCWSKNENPTIDDNKTEDGTGTGSFTSTVTDLEPNTTYYLRAYATNNEGTGYGSALSFTTQEGNNIGTFTDPRDGKVYQTIEIGDQQWMAENLAYVPSSGNYWAYENDIANVETYGYLYDWQTALNVCPTGWHVPSDEEWTELIDHLGGSSIAGGKLKATGTIEAGTGLWYAPNTGATNQTGFAALPGGALYGIGTFDRIGFGGYWWTATEDGTGSVWVRHMEDDNGSVDRYSYFEELGISVRCIMD